MTDNKTKSNHSRAQMIGIVVAAVIAIAGIALWIFQLSAGMVNTNMRNLDSWGLYIIMFMLFVGLSAGGLIISSIPRVFGIKGFANISKVAIWTSICCTVLAVCFVVVDLGGPARLWHLFAYANMTSPLMWDIVVLSVYLIISIIYLWATIRSEKGKTSKAAMRLLSVIALVCAILVHTVTAWIFGLQSAHEFWYTSLLGPWFVTSALLSGLALVLLVVFVLNKTKYLNLEGSKISLLAKLLGVFTAVDLYFFACDLLTLGFPGGGGEEVVFMLTSGPLAPFFWSEMILGVITMIIAFVPKLRTIPFISVAAACAILGVFFKRIQLLIGGFQIENIPWPTVTTGPAINGAEYAVLPSPDVLIYNPSFLEIGIVVGVIALGACILLLGIRHLPLKPAPAEAAE